MGLEICEFECNILHNSKISWQIAISRNVSFGQLSNLVTNIRFVFGPHKEREKKRKVSDEKSVGKILIGPDF